MHIHLQILRYFILLFSLPHGLVLISTWNVLSESLWTSTSCSFMHLKWQQPGCGHPLRTMFWFQDFRMLKPSNRSPEAASDSSLSSFASCYFLCLLTVLGAAWLSSWSFYHWFLFPCYDALPGRYRACTDCSNEGSVQSSYKDMWGAGREPRGCLNDLFNLPFY